MAVRGTQVFRIFATVLALVATLMTGVAAVSAQGDATPAAPDEELPYQARINTGSCDALGDVAFELNDVTQADDAGTPAAPVNGAVAASPAADTGEIGGDVAESTTTVEASLEELVDEEYAITIHQGTEDADSYLACGDIVGSPASGALQIALLEDSESGVSGIAVLTSEGDSTTVTILITEGDIDTRGTPAATPTS